MLPNEREYRVGPQGYTMVVEGRGDAPNQHVRYEPGALVWLRGTPPPSADLQPTGRERRYETKVEPYYHRRYVAPPESKSAEFSVTLGFDEVDPEVVR